MVNYSAPTRSYLTGHDFFCGAGGGAIALDAADVEIVVSVNHWDLAIRTHGENFPGHEHDLTDITAVDPRRYPRADVGLFTPECKWHTPARGERINGQGQLLLWDDVQPDDPSATRSRVTMNEVYRFTEYHRYKLVFVENVVEVVTKWAGFQGWLDRMHALGYKSKAVFFNSQFSPAYPHATPQSRDRVYYVFWREDIGRDPDLDFRPSAYCSCCTEQVAAVQSWKKQHIRAGKYNQQYVYRCPRCTSAVRPAFTPVWSAIDFSLPAEPVGGRRKPLEPKTIDRIKLGMVRFGRQPLLVDSGFNYSDKSVRAWPISEPSPAQTTAQTMSLLVPNAYDRGPVSLGEAAPTQTTRQDVGLAICPTSPFMVEMHGTSTARAVTEPCGTVLAGGNHHHVCIPPEFRGFLSTYYSNGWNTPLSSVAPAVTTKDRHALVRVVDDEDVNACLYRMLNPDREIKRIMGFPPTYKILGNQRDQTKQLGHSLSPGTLTMIVRRGVEILR